MSDQDKNVFESAKTTAGEVTNQTNDNNGAEVLVGEGRKYKTVEELAKAYLNADNFIEQLKDENRQLREKMVESKTVDDVLSKLESSLAASNDKGANTSTTGLDAQAVMKLVEQTVTGLETRKSKESNLVKANEMLKAQFGEKYREVYECEASTPELRETYKRLAEVSPEKFIALFGGKSDGNLSTGSVTDSGNRVNSAVTTNLGQGNRATTPGTKEYYNEMRRKDPSKYYSQAVQLEIHKAAIENSKLFYGRT